MTRQSCRAAPIRSADFTSCGVLSPAEAAAIQPCDEELSAVAWSTRPEWTARLAPHMGRRIDACMHAVETGRTVYLQYGWPRRHRRSRLPG
ncbi:hypothetical protein ACFYOK_36990 [Microbispora bryophytorum]|uniref:hypothetical protein n=1 Tax=Microbispora bryophytorum TaxID=1460882 RepID=UPI0033E1652F